MQQQPLRGAALLAIAGVLIASISTAFHGGSDPGNLLAVLPEYAANPNWKAVHLGEFIGYLACAGSLIVMLSLVRQKSGSTWALLGLVTATVTVAVYAANHAVDGVAVRYAAEAWVSAPPEGKAAALQLAEAMRHIEQGLSGMVALNLGLTLWLSGAAILSSGWLAPWLGWAALPVGGGYALSGVLLYYFGFSQHEFSFWMSMLLLLWLLAMALVLWRASERPQTFA